MGRGSFQNHKQWRKYACCHLCSYKFSYFIIYNALTVIESFAHKYTKLLGCCAAQLEPRPSTTNEKNCKMSNGKKMSAATLMVDELIIHIIHYSIGSIPIYPLHYCLQVQKRGPQFGITTVLLSFSGSHVHWSESALIWKGTVSTHFLIGIST